MKWPNPPQAGDSAARAEYEYERRKLELRTADLMRYRIHAVMIDSYIEITEILERLDKLTHSRDVLVSGSAVDYDPLGRQRIEEFLRLLGARLVQRGYRLISGFGLGIGSSVTYGALSEIHSTLNTPDKAVLMPFPQELPADVNKADFYIRHREQLIRAAGFAIFVCGNRQKGNGVELAAGVLEEFAIAAKNNRVPIPFAASGSAAANILAEIRTDPKRYYGDIDVSTELVTLENPTLTNEAYLGAIFSILHKFNQ